MFHWNLPWWEGFYCLLWRTSARHKDFIHRVSKKYINPLRGVGAVVDREVIELNFDSLEELLASNSSALGSVLITSDYDELICYQTHQEQIIRENVLTGRWFLRV